MKSIIKQKVIKEIKSQITARDLDYILHFILTNKRFLEYARSLITPELFSKEYEFIVTQALKVFDKYKEAPGDILLSLIPEHSATIKKLLNIKPYSGAEQVLLDKLLSIYRYHLSTQALDKSQELIQKIKENKVENSTEILDDIINMWLDIKIETTKQTHYGLELTNPQTVQEFLETVKHNNKSVLYTYYSEFDKNIPDGMKTGDVILIQAPTGVGKSMFMMNMAVKQLLHGNSILYLTLELNETQVYKRFLQIITGKGPLLFKTLSQADKDIIGNYFKEYQEYIGSGRIIYATPRKFTTSDIRLLLFRLKTLYNFSPNILFIDYADYLKPSRKYMEKRFELEQIFLDLQALSDDIDIPIVTASQVNRKAAEKIKITNEDVSEGYTKSQLADLVAGLNYASETESLLDNERHLKLNISKNRLGPRNQAIDYTQDVQSTRMWEANDYPKVLENGFLEPYLEKKKANPNEKASLITGAN